jgi:hypothetical protein
VADIRVEEGRRRRLWPLAVALLLLLLLVWALALRPGRGGAVEGRDDGTRVGASAPARPAPAAQEPSSEAQRRERAQLVRTRMMA